jgi:uncharacterized protein with GYD domain
MNTLGNFKTFCVAKAESVNPESDRFKTVAAAVERYGFKVMPQMDLLYVESCLVSAGLRAGVNDNDDIFTREEAWAARHTPALKPLNWQHQDKDIVGVMYSVQARDLDGNILDFDDDTPPSVDFDLWTEAVVFRLIHQERANEIEARVKAGDLFVSMEAWFDNYQYGLFEKDGTLCQTIARNKSTAFLDEHLRANRGDGLYEGKRIGRVLSSITFGGCGFVDRPANKRSFITDVHQFDTVASSEEEQIRLLLERLAEVEANVNNLVKEEVLMNAQADKKDDAANLTKADIQNLLDEREKAQAQKAELEDLKARVTAAESKNEELEAEINTLNEAGENKGQEVDALNKEIEAFNEAVDTLVQTEAGATDSTPSEIAAIDAAGDSGDAVWKAKLAWLEQSMAELRTKAARADELEAELAKAAQIVREEQVRATFKGLPEDTVEVLVSRAADLDEEAYDEWLAEHSLVLMDMAGQTEAADDKAKKEDKMKNLKKGKEKDEAKADVFDLLRERLQGSEGLTNHPGGEDVKSGVNPGTLRTQRHKIAGSAADGDDLAGELDNVEEESNVDLAGASQAGDNGNGVNPFAALAAAITETEEDAGEEAADKRPGFDPVE